MILVDISVPALDEVFDFELDGEAEVNELIKRIAALIAQVQEMKKKEVENLYLYHLQQKRILNPQMTLKQQGVQWGDRLILL